MKSLKITLLLAVVCLALVGLTTQNPNTEKTEKDATESFDAEDLKFQMTTKILKKVKPPTGDA